MVKCAFSNKFQWNFNQSTKLFIHENASDNIVCEMAAILSRGKWVKWRGWFQRMMPGWYDRQGVLIAQLKSTTYDTRAAIET